MSYCQHCQLIIYNVVRIWFILISLAIIWPRIDFRAFQFAKWYSFFNDNIIQLYCGTCDVILSTLPMPEYARIYYAERVHLIPNFMIL